MRYKRSFSKNFSITLQNKKFNFKQPKIQQLKMHSIKIERLSPIGIESINNSLHLNLSKPTTSKTLEVVVDKTSKRRRCSKRISNKLFGNLVKIPSTKPKSRTIANLLPTIQNNQLNADKVSEVECENKLRELWQIKKDATDERRVANQNEKIRLALKHHPNFPNPKQTKLNVPYSNQSNMNNSIPVHPQPNPNVLPIPNLISQ